MLLIVATVLYANDKFFCRHLYVLLYIFLVPLLCPLLPGTAPAGPVGWGCVACLSSFTHNLIPSYVTLPLFSCFLSRFFTFFM